MLAFIFSFGITTLEHKQANQKFPKWRDKSRKIPFLTATAKISTMAIVVLLVVKGYNILPKNTMKDCRSQCEESVNPEYCYIFCDCIHKEGKSLKDCLAEFEN